MVLLVVPSCSVNGNVFWDMILTFLHRMWPLFSHRTETITWRYFGPIIELINLVVIHCFKNQSNRRIGKENGSRFNRFNQFNMWLNRDVYTLIKRLINMSNFNPGFLTKSKWFSNKTSTQQQIIITKVNFNGFLNKRFKSIWINMTTHSSS